MYARVAGNSKAGSIGSQRDALLAGVCALALSLGAGHTEAAEAIKAGDVTIKVDGIVTVGSAIRTVRQDKTIVPTRNGNLIGVPGNVQPGANQDDGNLNFNKGDPVSSVAKALVNVDVSYQNVGAYFRGKAWYDATLHDGNVPWGNLPNGYHAGHLSDAGFENDAKFASASVQAAYAYGKFALGEAIVSGRGGLQQIPWGSQSRFSIPGGLYTTINAIDFSAVNRPGAVPEEMIIPMAAVSGRAEYNRLGIEAFYQFDNTHNIANGCGTFNSLTDYVLLGCNGVMVSPALTDPAALAGNTFAKRAPNPTNSDPQFGVGLNYDFKEQGTKLGVYYARVDSRTAAPSVIKTTRTAAPFFAPGDPGNRNAQYFIEYAEDVQVVTGTLTTSLPTGTTFNGEATFKHDAPINLNAGDLIAAFTTNPAVAGNALLRADERATALGGIFHGFDRYDQGHYQAGVTQVVPNVLGASRLVLGGEAAVKQVYGLPDVTVRRYGRPDVYGNGPIPGVACVGPEYTCTSAGFVTGFSWGYRLRGSMTFDNVGLAGMAFTPSIGLTHDVKGWSADNVFSEGRKILNLGLHGEYNKMYFADVTWNPAVAYGRYDNSADRQIVSISGGIRF